MRVYNNFDLTDYNSYRIPAICKIAYFPETKNDISDIFSLKNDENKIILGGGNNIILSKSYYDESFVIFSGNFNHISLDDSGFLCAESGASMLELSEFALDKSLSGLEVFFDIPSSLGGAIVMNAGAGGEDIKDLLSSVEFYDPTTNSFAQKTKQEMDFSYRNSYFQVNTHLIVTEAKLHLRTSDTITISNKMTAIRNARWSKQPKEYPNAGSVFKRPPGKFVGPMIEELGLKGFQIGGAKISEKHAGFIINMGDAIGQDIIDLITHVKEKVLNNFDVDLEVEQRII
ncbi:UDP-N-acetylmuramate dehydrogenase [Mucilaginibacter gynuensis]|uniref:UDP-N-acetylenolpyruvoylglucosamine reductase n=2 Tax=Mucilaginibacter gynuensis TaxID=1302236 RepID=A0ABP8GXU2_9SPHI